MPKAAAALQRCFWSDGSELYDGYHDREWGRPVIDDVRLFEKISLEGFQAGLSWITILRKREHFRAGFDGFARPVQCFADGGEIADGNSHASNSEKGMKETMSPWAMVVPVGLSTTPSPQTTEVRTPELWLVNRSSPPAALRRTRRNSRRLSAFRSEKWAGSTMVFKAISRAPCKRSKNGRTSSRQVMSLDTGSPGRPCTA